jgi:chromosome segregation protein
MIFISRLKLRNFKSFKFADISFPKTFVCLAGPNGSGKSNICDAIRFALGETSLKSLRAKKVRDLIFHDASAADVTLILDGDKKYEIKRAIRSDGKILYKLNGKKTTRWAILDVLARYNIDESGRNTIAQGEVQRIIDMNAKERRAIIDSVAGISEFEEKKLEALKELEVVDGRLKDANIILGERMAFLEELRKEREVALQFLENKKKLNNAKGSLLKIEAKRYEEELKNISELDAKLKFNLEKKETELKEIEAKMVEIEKMRSDTSKELQLRQQTASLIKRVEELKASINSKTQIIADKEAYLKKLEEESMMSKELEKDNALIKVLVEEIDQLKKELAEKEKELSEELNLDESEPIGEIKRNIAEVEEEYNKLKEKFIALDSEIKAKNDIIEIKVRELESIKVAPEDQNVAKLENEIKELSKTSETLSRKIDDSFSRIKELNAALVEVDKKLLELREKASVLKIKSSPTLINPALDFVNLLKQKGEAGIFGCIVDLIKFDPRYAVAVEAAAGSRLFYVVVDTINTATKIIEKLKATVNGRVTFIPLKEIKVVSHKAPQNYQFLSSFISYQPEIKKAVDFVFGDTVLVDNSKKVEEIGIGDYRIVTLDGEVFERSGLVSGGRIESTITLAAERRKLDSSIDELKAKKEQLTKELFAVREEEAKLRSQKTEIEIKLKTLEMKLKFEEERKKEYEEKMKRREIIQQEVATLRDVLKELLEERQKIEKTLATTRKKLESLHTLLKEKEDKLKAINEEVQRKKTANMSRVSALRAMIDGKSKELELRKEELLKKQTRLKDIEKEKKSVSDKINEMKRELVNENEELQITEEKILKHSSEIEKLFEAMKKYEAQLQEIGYRVGEKKAEIDKLNKEIGNVTVRKATIETRLDDIAAELKNYPDFEFVDLPKDELTNIIKQCEETLANIGNVNLAAIEAYERKKEEISEIENKVKKLEEERNAILTMISEIEEKKKVAFFDAFNSINENFRKIFSYVDMGEGYLYLDNPKNPFESNLYIKIKRNNKEYSLDSLSGGENSVIALMFIFALQLFKPSPFYVLDEVDAALDKENSKRLIQLIKEMSKDSQFIVVSHNDAIMSEAQAILGVTRVNNTSKVVGVKLEQIMAS